jgi:hypothetical protein
MLLPLCVLAGLAAAPAAAEEKAPAPPSSPGQVADRQLSNVESELVSLVEAMPEDKLDFKPAGEGFKESRTFRQQVGHVGGSLHAFGAALLGEDTKKLVADEENGPAGLKTKAALVAYLKDAFAHAHKGAQTITSANMLEVVQPGPGFKISRLGLGSLMTWHSFDHYGQLVVYARLNGIVPPASRKN